jgi:hypothetical protein
MAISPNLMEEVFSRIRPLGFGGLLGAGLMGLSYILLKEKLPPEITYHYFFTVGGLIGAGFHQLIDNIFSYITCGSIGRFVFLFERLIQLSIVGSLISPERVQELKEQVAMEIIGIPAQNQIAISDNSSRDQSELQQQLALLELERYKLIEANTRTFEEMEREIQKRVEENLSTIIVDNRKKTSINNPNIES